MAESNTGRWWKQDAPPQLPKKSPLVGRIRLIILAALLVLAGVFTVCYPMILERFYEHDVTNIKIKFEEAIENPPPDLPDPNGNGFISAFDALYAYLKAENEKMFANGQENLTDAFSYQQPSVDLSEYGIKDNIIGFISLPTINMELPIYLGANNENMKKGAVHLTNTSYPIGGENTNTVIAAHRGTSLVMFRNIHLLKIGDEITITNFRETLTYKVTETKIIVPTDLNAIRIQPGKEMITLSSCNPLGKNYQRMLIYCERVR